MRRRVALFRVAGLFALCEVGCARNPSADASSSETSAAVDTTTAGEGSNDVAGSGDGSGTTTDTSSSTADASSSADTSTGDASVCGDSVCDASEHCVTCSDCPCPDSLGTIWIAEPDNPVIVGEPCPSLTCIGTSDPSILRDDDDALLAWFSTGGIVPDGEGFAAVGPIIMHARRDADADAFVVDPTPVVVTADLGTWDRHVETVTVVRDPSASGFAMFYLGYEAHPGDPNHTGELHYQQPAIGRMTALDTAGLQWQRGDAPIYRPEPDGWDGIFVSGTSVLVGPDGVWRLYYSGAGTTVGVGLLMSDDGITWSASPDNPVIERDRDGWDEGMLEPTVRYFGGQYWMWYSGYLEPLGSDTRISIGLATSSDGVEWTRHPTNPVLEPDVAGSWDDLRILSSEVLVEADGSLLMAAYGCNTETQCEMGELSIGLWRSS